MAEFDDINSRSDAERSNALAQAIRPIALLNKQKALGDGDLASWMQASSQIEIARNGSAFTWIYPLLENGEDYTAEDFFNDESAPERKGKYNKEVSIINQMYRNLSDLPDQEGKATILIKKIRDKEDSRLVTWKLMGKYPEGSRVLDPNWESDVVGEGNNEGIIYMETHQACSAHACDEAFKKWKSASQQLGNAQEGYVSFGYVDYSNLREIRERLEEKSGRKIIGFTEFMDPETRETLDAEDTVAATLAGMFSNEQDRYLIPKILLSNKK